MTTGERQFWVKVVGMVQAPRHREATSHVEAAKSVIHDLVCRGHFEEGQVPWVNVVEVGGEWRAVQVGVDIEPVLSVLSYDKGARDDD